VESARRILYGRNLGFLGRSRYFFFQTHYYPENMVAPGIEPGTCGSVARNSGHRGDQTL
jgi:hypothetical protein